MLRSQSTKPMALKSIFSDITKRRIEPTSESSGKVRANNLENNLQGLALKSLLLRVTPTSLGFRADILPAELRLRLFYELSMSEKLGDSAIELLVETEVKYIRITRAITDEGLERLGKLCPQLERVYIRTPEMTMKGMLSLVGACKNLKYVDVGWTKIFSCSPAETEQFFSCLPQLDFLGFRNTEIANLDHRLECLKKFCPKLSCLNMGRVPISTGPTISLLAELQSLDSLIIDRIPLVDKPFLELLSKLGPKLLKLELGDTLVSDKAITQIPFLCPRLESLGLRNLTGVTDFGLVNLLGSKWNEENMEVEDPQEGEERPPRLKLKFLDLGGCFELSDMSVGEVSHIAQMEELNLEGLIRITEVCLRKIVKGCPALQKIECPSQISASFKATHFKGKELRIKQATTIFTSY